MKGEAWKRLKLRSGKMCRRLIRWRCAEATNPVGPQVCAHLVLVSGGVLWPSVLAGEALGEG